MASILVGNPFLHADPAGSAALWADAASGLTPRNRPRDTISARAPERPGASAPRGCSAVSAPSFAPSASRQRSCCPPERLPGGDGRRPPPPRSPERSFRVPCVPGGWRSAGCLLVAAFALLAAFAFSTGARAESHSIICNNGYWFVTNMDGFGYADRKIPCDERKPGWIFDWDGPHHIRWVYDGDREVTPYADPGSNVVRTAVREVQAQGNTRPPVNQPVASVFYTVPDSSNHRAVRGTDGLCYREQRVGGRWQRSTSFGSDDDACRRAAWNAYYLSQGRSPVDHGGTFPSGSPPARSVLESAAVEGKTLTLTFNENLDPGSLPSRWAFRVTVNGAWRGVASGGVAISGKTVTLTLTSAVTTHLDTVRVRYTRPSVRPLRGATGLAVATFTDQVVTNNTLIGIWSATLAVKSMSHASFGCQHGVPGKACPDALSTDSFVDGGVTYQVTDVAYIHVSSLDPHLNQLVVRFDQPASRNWTLHVGDRQFPVANASLADGDKSVTWSNPGFTWTANQQVSLRLTAAPLPAPTLQSGTVAGKTLTLTFDENLDPDSLPSPGAFRVTVNGARRGVASGGVAIAGQTVKLTLVSAVTPTDTVRVGYTRPSVRPLLRHHGGAQVLESFADRAVTNNTVIGIWSATLTTGPSGQQGHGCRTGSSTLCSDALTEDTFTTRGGTTYQIEVLATGVTQASLGFLDLGLDKAIPQEAAWTLHVGDDWQSLVTNATLSTDRTSARWTSPGFGFGNGQEVSLRLTTSPPGTTGVTISVADARANEAAGASVDFEVSLSSAVAGIVTVDYATADGSAAAGADYTATSGMLTFASGETSKTVSVPVLDDAVDEGEETFVLRLSNVQGARAGDLEATGTISNDDPLQKMWLSRFGRTVASHVTDAVSDRLANPLTGAQVTVAGQRVDLAQAEDGAALTQALTGLARAFGASEQPASGDGFGSGMGVREGSASSGPFSGASGWPGTAMGVRGSSALDGTTARDLSGRELLLGSAFHLAAEGDGTGPGLAAWGRVTFGVFDGEESSDGGGVRIDGEVTTGILGADAEWNRVLAGVAVSVSEGEGSFAQANVDSGTIESTMTTVSPYARVKLSDRVSAWGLMGYGTGDMTIRQAANDATGQPERITRSDLSMRLAALGGRGALLQADETGGIDLALKADAFYVETTSEAVSNEGDTTADASRVRLALEGSRAFEMGDGVLTPGLELGLRHDGGDAETGTGAELGGRVTYTDPETGLSVEASVRALVAHEDSKYRERGASGAVRLAPGERGRGLSFSLAPTWGAAGSGVDRLWSARDARGLAPNAGGTFEPESRLEGELGYGMGLLGDRFTGTPNLGFGLSGAGARDYRIGWRFTSVIRGDPGFEVNLDAMRREPANDAGSGAPAEHGVMLRGAIRW